MERTNSEKVTLLTWGERRGTIRGGGMGGKRSRGGTLFFSQVFEVGKESKKAVLLPKDGFSGGPQTTKETCDLLFVLLLDTSRKKKRKEPGMEGGEKIMGYIRTSSHLRSRLPFGRGGGKEKKGIPRE